MYENRNTSQTGPAVVEEVDVPRFSMYAGMTMAPWVRWPNNRFIIGTFDGPFNRLFFWMRIKHVTLRSRTTIDVKIISGSSQSLSIVKRAMRTALSYPALATGYWIQLWEWPNSFVEINLNIFPRRKKSSSLSADKKPHECKWQSWMALTIALMFVGLSSVLALERF